ncbi:hypothetical protein BK133_21965 [Paenibacillus sp. FSL H8-0548]|nr:hypothetical protein BK133_21965 [Paenibacillus sp. FSL H8-0548]
MGSSTLKQVVEPMITPYLYDKHWNKAFFCRYIENDNHFLRWHIVFFKTIIEECHGVENSV